MLRIDYTIIWFEGETSGVTNSIDCSWHWVEDDTPTSEILERLWEDVRDFGGDRAWLGKWEAIKE